MSLSPTEGHILNPGDSLSDLGFQREGVWITFLIPVSKYMISSSFREGGFILACSSR